MDDIAFATLKIGDFCFDVPIEVVKESKPFSIECVAELDKVRGGVEDLKRTIKESFYKYKEWWHVV